MRLTEKTEIEQLRAELGVIARQSNGSESFFAAGALKKSYARQPLIDRGQLILEGRRYRRKVTAIKQLQRAIKKRNRVINRVRHDNPRFRKWCYLYGTNPAANNWVDNTGACPEVHIGARVDLLRVDGQVMEGVCPFAASWETLGRYFDIAKWRFHNSMEKRK